VLNEGDEIDIWVVEQQLGSGGMGSVYRCHNRNAKRILAAVKTLDASIRRMPEAEARFIREAEILFTIEHPNIVKVRNVRMDLDPPYLEMEFVEGESLEYRLRHGALPLEEAYAFGEQLASAVAYLHDRNIRHRDIKPANVVIQPNGTAKLVDFGLAMEADVTRITQQGMTFGTVSYAPPEWISPEKLDPERWDIYALGVVLWEMLTGRVAFPVSGEGSARQQAMQVIIGKQNADPLDPGPQFRTDIRQLVAEMTAADPDQRPDSAAAVVERLAALEKSLAREAGPTLMPGIMAGVDDPPQPTLGNMMDDDDDVSDPSRRTGVTLVLGTAGVVATAGGALVLAAVAAVVAWPMLTAGTGTRDMEVIPLVDDGVEVDIQLGDVVAAAIDGGVFRFFEVPVGQTEAQWAIGPGCQVASCVSGSCPEWCTVGSGPMEIVAGTGIDRQSLAVPTPESRPLVITAIGLADDTPVMIAIEGQAAGELAEMTASWTALLPGPYTAAITAGVCPEDAPANCSKEKSCPTGCSAMTEAIVIPAGSGPVDLQLQAQRPHGKRVIKRPDDRPPKTGPAKVDPPATGGAARSSVTHAQYARWLAKNPQWQRDAAVASGKANAAYLEGWDAGTPPAGMDNRPIVSVHYLAAAAYCAGRAGLADIEAEPKSWPESGGAPAFEYRQKDGKRMWRSADGATSAAVEPKESNSFTTFRCAR
jgi:tRNA A-37 threonylcarbamoyl transferase component Bud32